jgi:multisubunit Na+/H+ antiporter MnhE subunit
MCLSLPRRFPVRGLTAAGRVVFARPTPIQNMLPKDIFIRNLEAERLRENFLVSAVAAIFIIRFVLFLTGYPQLGRAGLHIAHMLWGGFFMLVAIILLLSFLTRAAVTIASIVGGAGFGIFIDELGKFITSDNNYFFRPTAALIYVIFILLYLLFRAIPTYQRVSEREYVINAIEIMKEIVMKDLDIEEEKQALAYLAKSDQSDPLVKTLIGVLHKIEAIPPPKPSTLTHFRHSCYGIYIRLAQSQRITKAVIFLLLFQSVSLMLVMTFLFLQEQTLSFAEWGNLISSLISTIFVISGLHFLKSLKVKAYQLFKLATLTGIF